MTTCGQKLNLSTWRLQLCLSALLIPLALQTHHASAQCPAWFPPTVMDPLSAGTQSFAVHNKRLIISGTFTSIGGISANGLASFDGATFTPMTSGRISPGGQLARSQGRLYITGGIAGTAGQYWTESSWATWPNTGTSAGSNVTVRSIHSTPSLGIFAEGSLLFPGGVLVRHAIWTGSIWQAASTQWGPNIEGSNFFQHIFDVQEFNGLVYVAGDFASIARGTSFNQNTALSTGICIFDGSQWMEMPRGGVNGTVRDMIIFRDQLYLAGDFTATRDGAIALNRIARFDGTTYFPVSIGSGFPVSSMCVVDDGTGEKLFLTAGALLRYDGTAITFLPTLHGTPLISAAFDPGFGAGVFVGGAGLPWQS